MPQGADGNSQHGDDVIEIGDTAAPVPPDVFGSPGGFAWWYADVVTPAGDGAVLIWSYGLPFLPGYADAARRGAPQRPTDRPSVNLAVYRRGAPAFYLLQEHPAEPADGPAPRRPAGVQEIGGCRFRFETDGGRCTLGAELDCALPGTRDRLTGTVRIVGAARRTGAAPSGGSAGASADPSRKTSIEGVDGSIDGSDRGSIDGSIDGPADGSADGSGNGASHPSVEPSSGAGPSHLWTPMTGPAEGEVSLDVGGAPLVRIAGRAYHDRNHGRVPLHALGIGRWMWGRFPLARSERIYYLLWPEDGGEPVLLGVEIGHDGATRMTELTAELGTERKAFGGLARPGRIALRERASGRPWLSVFHRATVDAGPFYLRLLSEGRTPEGEAAVGWGELCVPDRVDLAAHRPFVRMRVHRTRGANSPWLPLFTGPREGRAGRLLRHVLSGGGA